ncbi:MAG: IPTL-CTERM sorting domain-containing protein [Thermoanaerobaculia bacterium]|nr:IPTL-CTERM sorting domain-containing protein [Thermoanaerobaculia bacterium]
MARFRLLPLLGLVAGMLAMPTNLHAQCVSLTTAGSAVSQNFDTLSNTAGSTTNNLTITGWFMTESGGGARDNEQYAVDTGGSNTGDTFSYGAAASTERALGGLQSGTLIPIFGACFTNNTGVTLTEIRVDYTGEHWRLGTLARNDQIDFQYSLDATSLTTGLWTDVNALDFVTPTNGGTTGARDGNTAPNRTALTSNVTALSIANGATFWIRWTDLNASGADDGLAVDDFSLTPNPTGGPVTPNLSINDVSLAEGNAGTTSFLFTVSLSAPAGAGGVTFDIATADNTATTADNDYVLNSLTGQTIPAGSSTYAFNVLVNGDTTVEANQTFFVNVTNVVGAIVTDGQGLGTINNDDVSLTPIHDIQGPGSSSPIVGASVTTRGIVTGVKSNGFFIQEPEATYDADPATSEGVLVFTSSAPPAGAVLGALVQVTGTVTEFVPTQDPLQPPLTEITSPTVLQISTGNPLPAPIPLTATFPDPTGAHDQLERVEGMRVSVASLTVTGPTLGNVNEPNATATSTGVFYGVVTGVARPFREAGIQAPDPPPAGTIPPIPRFDSNPERIRVDSDSLVGGPVVDVGASAVVTGLVGPLDYSFRTYTVAPDPGASIGIVGGPTPVAVTTPTAKEFTVASYNLERFFDTVNDPGIGEPVLTAAAFNERLRKASQSIRQFLKTPDVIGIVEIENLSTLQALATRIGTDAVGAGDPDPMYDAFLVEGNDVGGIDVGFLVKTSQVAAGTPRVEVVSVTQFGLLTTITNPDASTELLNDRPPLVLEAIIHHPNGASFPVTVIVNHLRSLNGVADLAPGPNGWATGGERVRNKRQKQAEFLADLIQDRQLADPTERIITVGDYNAFEVNDGFGDSMGVIGGTPAPDNQTAVPGDGVDLVNPDLVNLFSTAPATERYSFIFDGNAQSLDHVLVNAQVIAATSARREEHPRVNADFPETARNNTSNAIRLADHDPIVTFYEVPEFCTGDVAITKTDSPDPVTAGTNLTYAIAVTNGGPDPMADVEWTDTLPAGTTFVSLTSPGGWTCTTPAVGVGGTVTCSIASQVAGTANFTLVVAIPAATAAGTVISNTADVTSSTADSNPGNDTATTTTTVATAADLVTTKTATPDPVAPGGALTYTITVVNNGPSDAQTVALADTVPANTTFQSLTSEPGWTCTTPAIGGTGAVNCSIATLPVGTTATFTLQVQVSVGAAAGTIITNPATASTATPAGAGGNESDSVDVTVGAGSAEISLTKDDDIDPVLVGNPLTYTVTVNNEGPSAAANVVMNDPLPADATFQSLTAPGGWSCTTPAVGATGTVQCSIASLPIGSATFTIGVQATAGPTLTNTATVTSTTTDPQPGNESDTELTGVGDPSTDLVIGIVDTPDPVAAGSSLTYDVTATSALTENSNAVVTFLPASLTGFQSLVPPAGWSCVSPPVGSSSAVTCTLASWDGSPAVLSITVLVDATTPPATVLQASAAVTVENAGRPFSSNDQEDTGVLTPANLSATKVATGSFQPGTQVTYTIEVTNAGPATQADAPGDELTDILPAELELVSTSASSGVATADFGTNTVHWNGSIPPGGTVTITIVADLPDNVVPGTIIANQAQVFFDTDGEGTNDDQAASDDPASGGAADPTEIEVAERINVLEIPTVSEWGLILLASLLGLAAAWRLGRRE